MGRGSNPGFFWQGTGLWEPRQPSYRQRGSRRRVDGRGAFGTLACRSSSGEEASGNPPLGCGRHPRWQLGVGLGRGMCLPPGGCRCPSPKESAEGSDF